MTLIAKTGLVPFQYGLGRGSEAGVGLGQAPADPKYFVDVRRFDPLGPATGTIYGGGELAPTGTWHSGFTTTAGFIGRGLNGIGGYIDGIGVTSDLQFVQNTGIFTISMWVKPATTTGWIAGNSTLNTVKGFGLSYNPTTDNINFVLSDGSGTWAANIVTATGTLPDDNVWHSVIIVGDGVNVLVIIDGTIEGSDTIANTTTGVSANTLSLWRSTGSTSTFRGTLSRFRVYDYPVSFLQRKDIEDERDLTTDLGLYIPTYNEQFGDAAFDNVGGGFKNGAFIFEKGLTGDAGHSNSGTAAAQTIGLSSELIYVKNTGVFTMSLWAKFDDASDTGTRQFFSGNTTEFVGSGGWEWGYDDVDAQNGLLFRITASGSHTMIEVRSADDEVPTDGLWHFYTVIGNGSTCSIGIDNVIVASAVYSDFDGLLAGNNSHDLSYFCTQGAGGLRFHYFDGTLDEMRIYREPLDTEYLELLYNERVPVGLQLIDWLGRSVSVDGALYLSSEDGDYIADIDTHGALTDGLFGQALSLDGVADYAVFDDNTDFDLKAIPNGAIFTLNFWMMKLSTTTTGTEILFANQDTANANGFRLSWEGTTPDDSLRIQIWNGTGSTVDAQGSVGDYDYDDANWHMVTVTGDGTTVTVYLDGTSIATDTYGTKGTVNCEAALHIGVDSGVTSNWFEGNIERVRFYELALLSTEIESLYGENAITMDPSASGNLNADVSWFDNSVLKNTATTVNAMGWSSLIPEYLLTDKFYMEATVTTVGSSGACALVLSDANDHQAIDLAGSVAWRSNGVQYDEGDGGTTRTTYTSTDVLCIAWDSGKIFVRKNAGAWDNSGDPVAGTGAVAEVSWTDLYFGMWADSVANSPEFTINLGNTPFAQEIPQGYLPGARVKDLRY